MMLRDYCQKVTGQNIKLIKQSLPTISSHDASLQPLISRWPSYATEGALFISAQLSSDAVSALRKVWVLL